MINWDGKDKDTLALIKYIADEDKMEKMLENPQVIKTPVVRNGKQSSLGHQSCHRVYRRGRSHGT